MKFIRLWLPLIVWCAFIFVLSSIPSLDTGWGFWDLAFRKIAHISEYFVLAWLFYRAFKGTFNLGPGQLVFWPLLLSFLYAVSDEVHQLFIFGRSGNPIDVGIDTIGIILFFVLMRHKKIRSQRCALKIPK